MSERRKKRVVFFSERLKRVGELALDLIQTKDRSTTASLSLTEEDIRTEVTDLIIVRELERRTLTRRVAP